jgi:hypothetical protein
LLVNNISDFGDKENRADGSSISSSTSQNLKREENFRKLKIFFNIMNIGAALIAGILLGIESTDNI